MWLSQANSELALQLKGGKGNVSHSTGDKEPMHKVKRTLQ